VKTKLGSQPSATNRAATCEGAGRRRARGRTSSRRASRPSGTRGDRQALAHGLPELPPLSRGDRWAPRPRPRCPAQAGLRALEGCGHDAEYRAAWLRVGGHSEQVGLMVTAEFALGGMSAQKSQAASTRLGRWLT
jgi:hypothetical protein